MSEATALAVVQGNDAGALIRRSTDIAGLCREIVMNTAVQIGDRKYVKVEGWQSIATAHGCVASSHSVQWEPGADTNEAGHYRAVGEIRRISDGAVIATAEGFLSDDEPVWFGGEVTDRFGNKKTLPARSDAARRNMVQTRAMSRAARSAFAYIVTLIDKNLSTTPAEEMDSADVEAVSRPPAKAAAPSPPPRAVAGEVVDDGAVFPPYGKAKGQPVRGASPKDLEFYATGCERSLSDESKSRWHAKERALLDAIRAEQARQSGASPAASPPKRGFQHSNEPPAHTDNDAPF